MAVPYGNLDSIVASALLIWYITVTGKIPLQDGETLPTVEYLSHPDLATLQATYFLPFPPFLFLPRSLWFPFLYSAVYFFL